MWRKIKEEILVCWKLIPLVIGSIIGWEIGKILFF